MLVGQEVGGDLCVHSSIKKQLVVFTCWCVYLLPAGVCTFYQLVCVPINVCSIYSISVAM